MATIARVDVDATRLYAGEALEISDYWSQLWPSKGLPWSARAIMQVAKVLE